MKKNSGYTLIEMIIVIAIMAILAGVSVISIGIIKKAKANAAIDNFGNQLSAVWVKTKALSQAKQQTGGSLTKNEQIYPLCLKVERLTNKVDDNKRKGSYVLSLCYDTDGTVGGLIEKEELTILTNVINIDYNGSNGFTGMQEKLYDSTDDSETDLFVIQYNKSDGSVKYGSGSYTFYFEGSEYATVVLDSVTGNHYLK